ncbi:MAG: YbgC/FadM family acyl-CoA thioesterase [Sandaracinaceae bacterium]
MSQENPSEHIVQIYYEDTDFSGLVYHANYLKYFERAREHLLGPSELKRLYDEEGTGFVVYKVELTYREGARFGDRLVIRSAVEMESAYRALFHQDAHRETDDKLLVQGLLQLVCVGRDGNLVPLPPSVVRSIRR